ncbi:tRNA (adenosine(37)-N6)-threonylcarbamoyltransferase complex dimerization subunit type 1 TsaB [Paenibacillus athensensis]|uniref:tRNA (Adenosine(37)-N6)-threonylcarbamoyltransferase complex dimerization subunit type 1 TsaB n=1 Tax=Paenibacillus athensensis TaxID=1967502 RepID=A0A4Y8Q5C4_9BACL|nr:tRNA (adenosine(37)-N6)-threonylcarbamoyltransferase complex dimerization subunit type 1 TsaB [Paenibacillus athensensis]MCD1259558.1 tRNA (adenosine(37)-N6)-threonylcarbamoyltransferase complex dimerization subunit type 1 TsaB [Paenibacillus athensensis]
MTDSRSGSADIQTGRFLALDTSTASLTIAVLEQGRVLGELNTVAERNHSIGLLPNIRQLLGELGLKPRDLEAVAVGQGPGSYTGVRIGVSTAKTFAWALGIPLLGVSSLEALAYGAALADRAAARAEAGGSVAASAAQAAAGAGSTGASAAEGSARAALEAASAGAAAEGPHGGRAESGSGSAAGALAVPHAGDSGTTWIVPLMDARRTQAFTAVFAAAGTGTTPPAWRRVRADGIRLMGDWADELLAQLAAPDALADAADAARPRRIVFAGETAGFAEPIARVAAQAGCAVVALPHALQASALGLFAWPRLAGGEREDVHGFVPNYAQLPEAEVKLLAKAQKGDD